MTKVQLSETQPGQKVRMRPDTVTVEVHMHVYGQVRLILGNEGFWRDGKETVYLIESAAAK